MNVFNESLVARHNGSLLLLIPYKLYSLSYDAFENATQSGGGGVVEGVVSPGLLLFASGKARK